MLTKEVFARWWLERKTGQIATKLVPWLQLNGEKDIYSYDDVNYACDRAKIPDKYHELAYAIFCADNAKSSQLRQLGLQRYLAKKGKNKRSKFRHHPW